MGIEKRIEKLEQQAKIKEPERKIWVCVQDEPLPEGISEHDLVITVESKNGKQNTERVLSGERTDR